MKSFLISDNRDTLLGMRLAGIKGVIVHEKRDILNEINKALNDSDIGIIIITEKILNKAEEEIMDLKLKKSNQIIVTIPDRHGFKYDSGFITKYISESVGIKI
ncbi:MAG: ATP synthase subunit F [Firmicutes bacterium]|nr:ATP synthase subunit F [Bacillota bacterium]